MKYINQVLIFLTNVSFLLASEPTEELSLKENRVRFDDTAIVEELIINNISPTSICETHPKLKRKKENKSAHTAQIETPSMHPSTDKLIDPSLNSMNTSEHLTICAPPTTAPSSNELVGHSLKSINSTEDQTRNVITTYVWGNYEDAHEVCFEYRVDINDGKRYILGEKLIAFLMQKHKETKHSLPLSNWIFPDLYSNDNKKGKQTWSPGQSAISLYHTAFDINQCCDEDIEIYRALQQKLLCHRSNAKIYDFEIKLLQKHNLALLILLYSKLKIT